MNNRKNNRKDYQKVYREVHKEEIKAQKKVYREAHKEEIKAYNEAHKEEINAYGRAYYKTHKEKIKVSQILKRLGVKKSGSEPQQPESPDILDATVINNPNQLTESERSQISSLGFFSQTSSEASNETIVLDENPVHKKMKLSNLLN